MQSVKGPCPQASRYFSICPLSLTIASWVSNGSETDFATEVLVKPDQISMRDLVGKDADQIVDYLMSLAEGVYKDKQRQLYDAAQMLEFEKVVILRVVDSHWTDHIDVMDQFRQSVGLRGYGQLNPRKSGSKGTTTTHGKMCCNTMT